MKPIHFLVHFQKILLMLFNQIY